MNKSKPALDRVRVATGDTRLPRSVKPLLNVSDKEKRSDHEVVDQDGRNALVVVLRAHNVPLDERVVDFESWGCTEGSSIENSDGAFDSICYTLYVAEGDEATQETDEITEGRGTYTEAIAWDELPLQTVRIMRDAELAYAVV